MFNNNFLYSLAKRLVNLIKKEKAIFELEERLDSPNIVRPFSVVNPDRLHIGKNVLIQRNCHFHCGGMPWSDRKGEIVVGNNCWFSENNVLYGAGGIEIGDFTGTGPGVMIFSSRDDYSLEHAKKPNIVHQFGKVTIGSYVRIFSNVIVSPGVTIGDGAVIGAGSVVTKDIPEWSVAIGNPARVVGARDKDRPLSIRNKVANTQIDAE